MAKIEQTTQYVLETFGIERRHRTNSLPADLDLEDPRQPFSAYQLRERGVRGAFLLEDATGSLGAGSGRLVSIMHQRCHHPEWVQVTTDFRRGWCSLSDGMQTALLEAEREGTDDGLDGMPLSEDLARRIPDVTGFTPVWWTDDLEKDAGPSLSPDQTAFLWVLNAYQEDHGEPLQMLPAEELKRIPRFTD
ncbi:hypothetical protein DEJ38_06495 [Kocuria rosea]|uniref:hypothetical protein n=1 Tax=Kocuria rosea TaxID=1275 RepID=UPI000D643F84|nr:hypothetical protein [Kocuria rosea]PWF82342.1 hypothetical protein DEJ38_06495 [Kocuria rosea]